jgi:glucokinase
MSSNQAVACLDIGGSSIKSGLVRRDGSLVENSRRVDDVDSSGTASAILDSFSASLANLLDSAQDRALSVKGIGIAIGGPFDYGQGISKIRGLDKYESIYDVNVKKHLRQSLALPADLPLLFDIDAWSFARGEVWTGAGRGHSRVIVFTLGTGVGSAFAVDGRIVDEGEGVPLYGWISGQPYRDGILNDYISSLFLMRQYQALTGEEIDLRKMADRATLGDSDARQIYAEMATVLRQFVREHHVEQFGAECIIFGGQIAKSCHLFIDPFRETLGATTPVREIFQAQDIENSALRGAAKLVFDGIDCLEN